MSDDTMLDGKPIFRGAEHMADELEMCWNAYREQIWKKLPFEMRLENARLNRKMSRMVAAAANRLRESSKALEECDMHIEKLELTVGKMHPANRQ